MQSGFQLTAEHTVSGPTLDHSTSIFGCISRVTSRGILRTT